MSQLATVEPGVVKPPTRSRRKRWILIGILLACVGMGVTTYFYMSGLGKRRLAEAMARADQTDPGWQLDDLHARWRTLPDEQNSAFVVERVWLLSGGGFASFKLQKDLGLDALDQERELSERQTTALRKHLQETESALAAARKLRDMPGGQVTIKRLEDQRGWCATHPYNIPAVAILLKQDATLRAQEKDWDGALGSTRAEFNVGQSLANEPGTDAMSDRIAIEASAILQLERTLAQGEASDAALAAFQSLLEHQLEQPLFLIAARVARAYWDSGLASLQENRVLPACYFGVDLGSIGKTRIRGYSIQDLVATCLIVSPDEHRAALLEFLTSIVEAAKLPEAESRSRIEELTRPLSKQPALVRMMTSALMKMHNTHLRNLALLRAALTAVAAERYRLANGEWPPSITALVPQYLQLVPLDPFDHKPMRMRTIESGIVLYSIGPSGLEDGGIRNFREGLQGLEFGFRLWDLNHRRQPAKPDTIRQDKGRS